MSDLVVVSNRGPASLYEDANGAIKIRPAAGGLAPSLERALVGRSATWVAAATTPVERRAAKEGIGDTDYSFDLCLVDLDPDVVASAIRVVSNATLWFCHHGLFDRAYRPVINRKFHEAWEMYREYNNAIAAAVIACADEDATVLINDYHLSLLGAPLKQHRPDLSTVHFSHTPFASPDELRVLPHAVATELLDAMSAFGSCGFHVERWAAQFRACCAAYGVGAPTTFVAPLGVDRSSLVASSLSESCVSSKDALRARIGDKKLVVRSDRLELSKNIVRGFLAFEEFLETHPEWLGNVVFLARLYPSREELPEYLAYRGAVELTVQRINERFGTNGYLPIALEVEDDLDASIAASSCYDVLLVNPIRDGMNLVAKEGPTVNANNGVLVLSNEAGAVDELGECALVIDPFDVTATANAIHAALVMDASERASRAKALQEAACAVSPDDWFVRVVEHAALPS